MPCALTCNMGDRVGVLCHITSLPNENTASGKKFIDLIAKTQISAWQMLPITPPNFDGSPYSSTSAFAGDSNLISTKKEANMELEDYWIEDWALFASIKKAQNNLPWIEWPKELRDRHPETINEWRNKINSETKIQAQFQHSWIEMKKYANDKNIKLIGDIPIFVNHDSADVWAHRELFQLDSKGLPTHVAGVPPDYFSEDGQIWNTVLYNWKAHADDGWKWWKERIARMLRLFDVVRIDHFRGFHSAWAIPIGSESARNGFWQEGPKEKILTQLMEVAKNSERIIAEDLGIIPPDVIKLRRKFDLKGMAVLQFGFDGNTNNPHHPKNIKSDQVVYTGTHDNNTTRGWLNSIDSKTFNLVKELLNSDDDPLQGLIRIAKQSPAEMAIFPLQDLLNIGKEGRMNTPGTTEGNWNWKIEWKYIKKCNKLLE